MRDATSEDVYRQYPGLASAAAKTSLPDSELFLLLLPLVCLLFIVLY